VSFWRPISRLVLASSLRRDTRFMRWNHYDLVPTSEKASGLNQENLGLVQLLPI